MTRAFRFAASVPVGLQPVSGWRSTLAEIESMGFHTVAVADHFTAGYTLEPLTALAAVAMCTKTIRLQTHVLGNDYRHPVQVHRAAAMIDILSEGRLELGVGAGWLASDYSTAAIPFDPAGQRVDRWQESIEVIRGLFAEGPFHYSGSHYVINGLEGVPRAVQRPHPPLVLGGGGPRVLRIAARHADIVTINADLRSGAMDATSISGVTAEKVTEKVRWVHEAAIAAGRDPSAIELAMPQWALRITATPGEAATSLAKMAARSGMDAGVLAVTPGLLVGTARQVADKLLAEREAFGINYIHVDAGPRSSTTIHQFAPVIELLAGA